MNRQIQLNAYERTQEWVLLGLGACSFVCMMAGFLSRYAALPVELNWGAFMMVGIFVFIFLLGLNGILNGNLIRKWDPFQGIQIFSRVMEKYKIVPEAKIKPTASATVGFILIVFSILCFFLSMILFLKG